MANKNNNTIQHGVSTMRCPHMLLSIVYAFLLGNPYCEAIFVVVSLSRAMVSHFYECYIE